MSTYCVYCGTPATYEGGNTIHGDEIDRLGHCPQWLEDKGFIGIAIIRRPLSLAERRFNLPSIRREHVISKDKVNGEILGLIPMSPDSK